jgi:hypothetical protein
MLPCGNTSLSIPILKKHRDLENNDGGIFGLNADDAATDENGGNTTAEQEDVQPEAQD